MMQMRKYIDLHIHSKYSSDGFLSPLEIVLKACENDFRTIAISDHDTIAGVKEGLYYGNKYGVEVIPAVEVTTELNKHFYHILAYYFELSNEYINLLIKNLNIIRKNKNLFRIKKIKELDLFVPDGVMDLINNGELLVGPTLAKAVMDDDRNQGNLLVKKFKEEEPKDYIILFYKKIIKDIDKSYDEQKWLSTLEAIRIIRQAGSIPVLAHPGASLFYATESDIKMLKDNGLSGLEVYSTYHKEEQINEYKEIALKLNLLITGGSDFHGKVKKHIYFGAMKIEDYTIIEKLRSHYISTTGI